MDKRMRRVIRRLARLLGYTALGLCVVALCAVGAVLLLLRASWTEQWLADKIHAIANPILAEQGLSLELDSLRGPLPGSLSLNGIRLHDGRGLFLEIKEIQTSLALADLLGGSLTIETARVDSPVLHRLPEVLPAAGVQEPEQQTATGPGIALDLPLSISVKDFRVEEAVIPWAVAGLAPKAADTESTPLPSSGRLAWERSLQAPLQLDISGNALLSRGHLSASLQTRIRDRALPTGEEAATAVTPGSNLDVTLALDSIKATALIPTANDLSVDGNLLLMLGDIKDTLSIAMRGSINGQRLLLQKFLLDGLGLQLRSSAEVDLETGKPSADLTVSGQKNALWQTLTTSITDMEPSLLDALVSPLALDIQVAHQAEDLTIAMRELRAGVITGTGEASISNLFPLIAPAHDNTLQTDNTGQNTVSDSQQDKNAQAPATIPGQGDTIEKEQSPAAASLAGDSSQMIRQTVKQPARLEAQLALQIDDLAPINPEISGPLNTQLAISGNLPDIQGNLTVSSKSLATPAGNLTDLVASLNASLAGQSDGSRNARGNITLSAAPDKVGDTHINTDWDIFIPAANEDGTFKTPATARVSNLQLSVFGLEAEGQLKTVIGPDFLSGKGSQAPATQNGIILWPQDVSLDGSVRAAVSDWAPLSSLAQMQLQGKDMTARVDLANDRRGQRIDIDLSSAGFNAPAQGAHLDSLLLKLNTLLPSASGNLPLVNLDLRTGKGQAADLVWEEVTAAITGNGAAGDFSARLLHDPSRLRHEKNSQTGKESGKDCSPQKNVTKKADKAKTVYKSTLRKDELFSLAGQYNLENMQVVLNSLAIKEPASLTEIQLRSPASVSLQQGIVLQGLTLDFSPGGSLTASVSHHQNSLDLQAAIEALPLALINDLAGTALPPGRLDTRATLKTGGQRPQGGILAELWLDQTPSVASLKTESSQKTRPASMTSGASGGMGNTKTGVSDPGRADVTVQAAFTQSAGRSYLTGGADFSQLASIAPAVSSVVPSQAAAPMAETDARQNGAASAPLPVHQPAPLAANSLAGAMPFTFRIPLSVTDGIPAPDMQGPFQAQLQWYGPLDGFWRLVPLPDTEFSALGAFDLSISGSLSAPRTGGTAYLAKGRLHDKASGMLLTDINLEAHATKDAEFRLVAAASDGGNGSLGLEGSLSLKDTPSLDLRGQIKHLSPLHRDDLSLIASGIFSTAGPLDELAIKADILVERGEITLLSTLGNGSVPTLTIANPQDEQVETASKSGSLDVTVNIPRRFYVRGRGLDSEWQGNMRVKGPLAEPQLIGSLRPVRGFFELLSKPFAFTGGEIVFAGGSRINPGLNLELTYTTADLEAVIIAGGNLAKPSLELQSRPVLPKDEVLARVLFGKNISELSRFEALQLANSMRELAGIGSGDLNPLTTMRKATGLDVLRFGSEKGQNTRQDSGMTGASNLGAPSAAASPNDTSAPTLEAGKYINDSIYIGVEQGMTQESTGVRIEIELFPAVTLQGKTTSTSSSAGIGWKMDY